MVKQHPLVFGFVCWEKNTTRIMLNFAMANDALLNNKVTKPIDMFGTNLDLVQFVILPMN